MSTGNDDMRRSAAQQASYGNYWAGKYLGLLDELEKLRDHIWDNDDPIVRTSAVDGDDICFHCIAEAPYDNPDRHDWHEDDCLWLVEHRRRTFTAPIVNGHSTGGNQ